MRLKRLNVRLKASKEERQDGYYSNGKGKRSTRISWLRKIFYRFATTARELFFYKTSHGNIVIDISFVNNGRTLFPLSIMVEPGQVN